MQESFMELLLQQIISNLNNKNTEADLLDYFVGDTDVEYEESVDNNSYVINNTDEINYNPYNYVYTDKDLITSSDDSFATDDEVTTMLESILDIEVS